MNKIYIADYSTLIKKDYVIKHIDVWKDELIAFYDKSNDKIKIFSSVCPHFGGEIYYIKKKNELKCRWHNWKFCTETGKCLSYPIIGQLNPYNFEVKPNPLNKYKSKIKNGKIFAIKNNLSI